MTEAEKYLKGMSQANAMTSRTPAEHFLKDEPTDVTVPSVRRTTSERPASVKPNVGLRILAVVVFLSFIFAGTYFAKTRQPPIPILGYVIGGIGFGLGGLLWRHTKR